MRRWSISAPTHNIIQLSNQPFSRPEPSGRDFFCLDNSEISIDSTDFSTMAYISTKTENYPKGLEDMAEELEDKISEVAGQPKKYENDGEMIENHSLSEMVEADRYLARKRAGKNPFSAISGVRISTQGPEK